MSDWTRKNFDELRGPQGLDVICIGGQKPEGGDAERFEDFWPTEE